MEKLLIYGIFIIALFGGLIEALGVPGYYAIGTEMFIVYLFLISPLANKNRRGYAFHLWYIFLFMILIALYSMVINGSGKLQIIYSLRLIFRFYFFYVAVTTLNLDDEAIKKLNVFIVTLLLLQLPVVAYKFHLYGVSELTMGAYALHGGALTTMLPMSFIFYLAAYYFLYQPKRWYFLAVIGFVLFSIAGAKRAVLFLFPIEALAIYYYIYVKGKEASFSKKVGTLILFFALIGTTSALILQFNETLKPIGKTGGSINMEYAIKFAQKYTMAEDEYGYSTGRVSSTIHVFKSLWDLGFTKLCLGLGPGSLTLSIFNSRPILGRFNIYQLTENELKLKYGLTTATRIAVEYGVLGVFTYFLFLYSYARMCLKYYKYETDPYWKAFAAGSAGFAFLMVFFFFTYADAAFWGDTMPALYFYAMAVVYTRLQRISVQVHRMDRIT